MLRLLGKIVKHKCIFKYLHTKDHFIKEEIFSTSLFHMETNSIPRSSGIQITELHHLQT